MNTDEYLMACFRDHRDYKCFQELTERYMAKAFNVAHQYLFDTGAAEDAVQEAFIKVVRRSNQFATGALFAPWFFRILRNICFDVLRKNRLHVEYVEQYDADDVYSQLSTEPDQSSDLKKMLAQLPGPEREVLVMKVVQDMTFAEIATMLDNSIEAVKKRSQRGLKHLRTLYERSRRRESVAI